MSRYFALQTWVGSHENEPDYDGNQCGSRNVRSVEAIPLYDIYGKANVNAFSDEAIATKRKPKAKRSAFESICLADSHYNRLERQMEALQEQFDNGELSWDDFMYAHKLQSERMEKAWKRVCKHRNWSDCDNSQIQWTDVETIKEYNYTSYDESSILNPRAKNKTDELFESLSSDNIFRKVYVKVKQILEILK